jgi:Ca2+-binding RTX toxin-like protein
MAKKNSLETGYNPTHGDDVLTGTANTDFMNGNGGNDTMTGGGGADVFWVSYTAAGKDVVTDFTVSGLKHDVLVFDGYGSFGTSLQGASFVNGAIFTTDTGHTLTVVDTGADTMLLWDTGDSITLQHVEPGQLDASHIVTQDHSYGLI